MSAAIALGSTYTYRVAKGRVAACRAIATRDGYTAVVGVAWEGARGATLAVMTRSRRFHRVQVLTHHNWKTHKPPAIVGELVGDAPPVGFRFVGIVPVTKAELASLARSYVTGGGWDLIRLQGRLQWRWDHERAKVLAEDRKAELAKAKRTIAAKKAQDVERLKLRKVGPRALVRRTWFSDFRPAKMRDACRALMQGLVADLVAGPRDAARITECVRAFNALDGKHGHSSDTPDAEQIMAALHEAADACGIADEIFDREVDALRDF
jgi:hypothetical protein